MKERIPNKVGKGKIRMMSITAGLHEYNLRAGQYSEVGPALAAVVEEIAEVVEVMDAVVEDGGGGR